MAVLGGWPGWADGRAGRAGRAGRLAGLGGLGGTTMYQKHGEAKHCFATICNAQLMNVDIWRTFQDIETQFNMLYEMSGKVT